MHRALTTIDDVLSLVVLDQLSLIVAPLQHFLHLLFDSVRIEVVGLHNVR